MDIFVGIRALSNAGGVICASEHDGVGNSRPETGKASSSQVLSLTYILQVLKTPKQTDVDGPDCTELDTGRDWHYAVKTGAHRRRQGY